MATEEDGAMDTADDPSADLHVKHKKKFMGPFKKMKNFFRKVRTKSKDDSVAGVGMRTKSTSDMLGAHTDDDSDEDGVLYEKRKLSMSADSVFTPGVSERVRSTTIPIGRPNMARSMETVPQPGFQHELFRKIKNRRGGGEDEGLPQSPTQTTTADVIENGLKRSALSESDNSLGSMESLEEMDDEFFQSTWSSVGGSKRKMDNHAADESQSSCDLDVVGSTSSLVSASVRHKLAVKPQGKRAGTKHRPQRTVPSPVPSSLPEVEEEETSPPDVVVEEATEEISEESVSPQRSEVNSVEVVADIEPQPSPARTPTPTKAPTPVPRTPTPEPEPEPKQEELKEEPVEKPQIEVKPAVVEAPVSHSSEENKEEAADNGKMFGGVVLRRTGKLAKIQDDGTLRRPNASRQDPSKRQTIAGDSAMFGERKVSVKEPKAKDDLHKPKVIEESAEQTNTEFTAMFNRLRKQTSQKRIELEKEDTGAGKKVAPGSSILGKTESKTSTQTVTLKPVVIAAKPTAKTQDKSPKAAAEKPANVVSEKSPRSSIEKAKVEEKVSLTIKKKKVPTATLR